MQNYPKITVITPSFNQGKFIGETINSVVGQDYPNLEYIIMDGGSSDETVEVIKQYQDKITYWESVPDKGQTDAINKGLKMASGDVFNWLNSDDIYEKGSLFKIGKAFMDEKISVVCGVCAFFDQETGDAIDMFTTTESKTTPEQTMAERVMSQPAQFYRMSVVRELGGQLEPLFRYSMDMELWFRYMHRFGLVGVKYIDDIICHFRWHKESKTVAESDDFRKDDNAILFTMLNQSGAPEVVLDHFRHPRTEAYQRNWDFEKVDKSLLIAYVANDLAMKHYSSHDYEKATECVKWAMKYGHPRNQAFLSKYLKLNLLNPKLMDWLRDLKNRSSTESIKAE